MRSKIIRLSRIAVILIVVLYISSTFVRQNYAASLEDEKKKQESGPNTHSSFDIKI